MPATFKKILIAEDDKPIAHALELKLAREGFVVRVAGDGEECLTFLKQEIFDLILLDLVMPKVDGFQVLEMMKPLKIPAPVIVLTNLSQQEDMERAQALGAAEVIVKSSMPLAEVVEHIARILETQGEIAVEE